MIILAGEILSVVSPWLERHVHPTILIKGLYQARDDALEILREKSRVVDENNREEMLSVVRASLVRLRSFPFFIMLNPLNREQNSSPDGQI